MFYRWEARQFVFSAGGNWDILQIWMRSAKTHQLLQMSCFPLLYFLIIPSQQFWLIWNVQGVLQRTDPLKRDLKPVLVCPSILTLASVQGICFDKADTISQEKYNCSPTQIQSGEKEYRARLKQQKQRLNVHIVTSTRLIATDTRLKSGIS